MNFDHPAACYDDEGCLECVCTIENDRSTTKAIRRATVYTSPIRFRGSLT